MKAVVDRTLPDDRYIAFTMTLPKFDSEDARVREITQKRAIADAAFEKGVGLIIFNPSTCFQDLMRKVSESRPF